MNDRYATTRKPAARPVGASSTLRSTYDGAELKTRSSRPGAYDAFAIPSLLFGKQEHPVAHATQASAAPPVSRQVEPRAKTYRPRPGSVATRVIDHLKSQGGTVRSKDIAALCNVDIKNVAGLMQRAIASHAVMHEIREGKGYFSLPGQAAGAEALPPHADAAAAARHAQALRDMAANADALSQSLEQLQGQCLFLTRAIHGAIAALPPITADLAQA